MSIRIKILSLLGVLFALLIVVQILVQDRVLMPSFDALERSDAKTAMTRVVYALDESLVSLEVTAADWGNWADVYEFVAKPTDEFLTANITPIALKQLQVNALMIVDLTGRVVTASARDLESGAPIKLDFALAPTLSANFPWRQNLRAGASVKGLLHTNLGVLMIAGAPILDGSGTGQARGMVIMGKLLTPEQVSRLASQAQAALSVSPAMTTSADLKVSATDSFTRVERMVADVDGAPLLTLRVDTPRQISQQGRRAVIYASGYLGLLSIVTLVCVYLALNRVVLGPIARVTRHAVAIGHGTDLTARLNLPGGDEIAVLAREFDGMVANVAESRRRLVDQSFRSGFAELAKGVLHQVGNAMTPIGVRVDQMTRRLRAAPVADIELAVRELETGEPDPVRRTDLKEFVRLAWIELVASVKNSRGDLELIERQQKIVQTALHELLQSTRTEAVIESVELSELITEATATLPKALRDELSLQIDDSVAQLGALHLSRTILRLVIQNILISAAASAPDRAGAPAALGLSAEVQADAGGEQLQLSFHDREARIWTRNLDRLFEQDRSSAPPTGGAGLGLHWCANAIAAMGGRLWAVPDGSDRGPGLRLQIPLLGRG
jgi:sensor domain CHASE-containing protein